MNTLLQDKDTLVPMAVAAVSLTVGLFIIIVFRPRPKKSPVKSKFICELKACKELVYSMMKESNCAPIMVRLAWHDSGTYNSYVKSWPECGGANGSIRFDPEINHGANAGLQGALHRLKPIKEQFPSISWADLMQMASVTGIELCGGPVIKLRYGRVDVSTPQECAKEGFLPGASPPFDDGSKDAATHLRKVFSRMGFDDQKIVALSGAHTIGRAFKDRSGVCDFLSGAAGGTGTKFTCPGAKCMAGGATGNYMPGGQSWTENWLEFDNSYFKPASQELLRLPTDNCLKNDPGFQTYVKIYAQDKEQFFRDYAKAHKKLSELGSRFDPPYGVYL